MPLYNPIIGAKSIVTGSTSNPTTTSATYVVIPEMTITLLTFRSVRIDFTGAFNVQSNDDFTLGIHENGTLIPGAEYRVSFFGGSLLGLVPAAITSFPVGLSALTTSTPGSNTYDIRWKRTAGTARALLTQRQLIVIETI